jgi:hypothetical protein
LYLEGNAGALQIARFALESRPILAFQVQVVESLSGLAVFIAGRLAFGLKTFNRREERGMSSFE